MTPESFNSALALRKLEAADILLIQAKRGSDADRIRAASAILRIAFMTEPKPQKAAPEPPVVKGAPESAQRSETPAATPPLPLPGGAGEGRGEGVTTLDSQVPKAHHHTPVPDSPYHRITGSPSHALSSA